MRGRIGVAVAMAVLSTASASRAQEARRSAALEGLWFMSGCWEGRAEGGTIEERYAPPAANLMTGTTRWFRDGRVIGFEFTLVAKDDEGVVLTPFPDGNRSEHGFRLESVADGRAVFAAPDHDFPKRIIYAAAGDSLVARIDGGEGSDRVSEWRMGRVSCHPDSGRNAAAAVSAGS
jgi:hypothetical protein